MLKWGLLMMMFSVLPVLVYAIETLETNEHLIVSHPRQSHIFRLPPEMRRSSSYRLVIYPHIRTRLGGTGTAPEDLNLLIEQANALYHAEDYAGAMHLISKAHELDPQSTRVNNMMGSLFYQMKNYEMAQKYWSTSLGLDANQVEVESFLKSLPQSSEPTPGGETP